MFTTKINDGLAVVLVLLASVAAAEEHPAADPAGKITAWGKPSGGLQAGIRCEKDKQVLGPGDEVELQVVVRNVSDKPIKFTYLPPTQYWGTAEKSTVVVTSMHMAHGSPRSDGLGFANSPVIHPGKELLLGAFSLGHVRPKDPKTAAAPRPELAPGKYQVGSENVLVPLTGDKSDWKLPTGYLDIQLLQATEEQAPAKKDQPASATQEQKVLTPAEAITQRPKENVTVQFKVEKVVAMPNPASGFGGPVYYIFLSDGGEFTARLAKAADQFMSLGVDPVKHFTGKVVRVTGRVEPDARKPSFQMWVRDLADIEVVKEVQSATKKDQQESEKQAAREEKLRLLIDKVLAAHGGEDKLSKLRYTMTVKHSSGETQHYFVQPPKNFRWETTHPDRAGKRILILFPKSGRWWTKEPSGDAQAFIPSGFEPPGIEHWLEYVKFFGPRQVLRLKDADYKVTLLDQEAKIGDRAAVGVQVAGPRYNYNMYFDKETHMLLKGFGFFGREVTYSDYKTHGGIPIAQKEHDGYLEPEVTDFRVVDKFDARLFEVP
jgi:hypothetical protein